MSGLLTDKTFKYTGLTGLEDNMNYMVARNRVNDLDRVFDAFFNDQSTPAVRVPAVDITESDKGYDIVAELPGFNEDELDIQVKENLLTISAERMEEAEKKEKKDEVRILKKERAALSFKRSFYLPKDASAENVEASFNNGLLTISIAKKEEVKPQVIKIKTK
jgi:HSP20 family molecular chaperone IbpA